MYGGINIQGEESTKLFVTNETNSRIGVAAYNSTNTNTRSMGPWPCALIVLILGVSMSAFHLYINYEDNKDLISLLRGKEPLVNALAAVEFFIGILPALSLLFCGNRKQTEKHWVTNTALTYRAISQSTQVEQSTAERNA